MNCHVKQERLALSGVDELFSNLHYILVYRQKTLTKNFIEIVGK